MGTPYISKSQSGYNISPPPDDGSAVAANICKWSDVKAKLGDPTLTLAQAINTALVAALDFTGRVTGVADTPTAADHMRTVECNAALAVTLPDAATIGAGFTVGYKNTSVGVVTVALLTAANTLDGVANGSTRIAPGGWAAFKVNTAANGYYGFGVNSHVGDSYYPIFAGEAGGTADALTATVETPLKALYEGMLITLDATATNLTTTPTLNLTLGATATGAKTITNPNGGALIAGDILGLHHRLILGYESVLGVWKLLNPGLLLSQAAADARYTPIAYSQYGGTISVNSTLAVADSGKFFYVNAGITATLPTASAGLSYTLIGNGASAVLSGGASGIFRPDGSTGSITFNAYDVISVRCDGASWVVVGWAGSPIVKNATATNQALALGQLATKLGFSNVFRSTDQTLTFNTSLAVPHGLGAVPYMWRCSLKCLTAEAGYSAGDVIDVTTIIDVAGTFSITVSADATNVTISQQGTLRVTSKTTHTSTNLTAVNWALVVTAWA